MFCWTSSFTGFVSSPWFDLCTLREKADKRPSLGCLRLFDCRVRQRNSVEVRRFEDFEASHRGVHTAYSVRYPRVYGFCPNASKDISRSKGRRYFLPVDPNARGNGDAQLGKESTEVSHVRSVEAGRSGGGHAKEESSQEACGKEDVVLDELLALLDDSGQLAVGPPGKLVLGLLHVLV